MPADAGRLLGRRREGIRVSGAELSPGLASAILFGSFFAMLVLRVPVAFALGLACLPIVVIEPRLSPLMLFNETFKAYNSFILLAVPFFLLTANLMNIGGISDRLVRLSRTMVGHFPGSLAQMNVLLSVFFAGISGSSTADAASQSKLFIEAQTKEGYGVSFSVAITAVSAVLAVIIPPSILMVVWGGVISTSIGAMYLAGILPGLLIAGAQMATVHVYAKKYRYPVYARSTWKEFLSAAVQSLPALATPVIIVGGILLGWFTATESAAIAVLYAIALTTLVYREMTGRKLYEALAETGRLAAVALFCVGTASAFGWLLAYYQIPKLLLAGVMGWDLGPIGVGLLIAFTFLVVGCFLDAIPAIIIVGTTLQPLAMSVDMHPVQFAIIGILSLAFGLVTPPYGLCLLIACAVAKVPLRYALKDTMIMLVPMLVVLIACIVWPEIPLFLPGLFSPDFLK
ncbi:MAG: TRAP transporter large permease [Burkholderiales bacterium]